MNPKAALERLFTTDPITAEWFAPTFLAQVPVSQIQQIIASLSKELGQYRGVETEGEQYRIVFERGTIPTKIALNEQGQISGLLFQSPRLKGMSLEDSVAAFQALPGQVSLLVLEGETERAALNANQPLAVGSTFKLAVLIALRQQIQAGQHTWSEVVSLQSDRKSLPSGFLHTWAEGSLLTVESLAALMISQSDNTATDHLIHLVGREAIEQISPRNRPFLMTREAFILKSHNNGELRQQYQSGDTARRRQLLSVVAQKPLPGVSEFEAGPIGPEIEWFFTTQELCQLMATVKDLPLMRINPGVATAQDWKQVAFKGGSEPGVLNLTTWLQAKNGRQYCVSATWNDKKTLDEAHFFTLYATVLESLK